MIFAELIYKQCYEEIHWELVAFLKEHFGGVESGLEGDSWIWIKDDCFRVEIDTFSSMRHQVKAAAPGPLLERVLGLLSLRYRVDVLETPEMEGHEGDPA